MTEDCIYKQRTVKKNVVLQGIGLFTGEPVSIELCPAAANTGIRFHRANGQGHQIIKANLSAVKGTPRCTLIGNEKANIQTVEHLLSALHAYQIDNVIICIKGMEVPAADGSARAFIDLIENSGIEVLSEERKIYGLKRVVYWTHDDIHIVALPSKDFRVSYTLHYPHSLFLRAQFYSSSITPEKYKKGIAPSRTFSLYEEIKPLLENNVIRGGGLNNAVIIKNEKVMNPEGIRFPEEMARHKILDLIGDLSLIGKTFNAHIIAIRSGHASNVAFAQKLSENLTLETNS